MDISPYLPSHRATVTPMEIPVSMASFNVNRSSITFQSSSDVIPIKNRRPALPAGDWR